MARRQKKLAKKVRGRPATGRGRTIGVRIHDADLRDIDNYIAEQMLPRPSRPQAIRQLVKLGIEAAKKS